MLMYTGFLGGGFPHYTLSHEPGQSSSCVYVPCQCGCELICLMLNTGSKN